jgi:hypothetical protein
VSELAIFVGAPQVELAYRLVWVRWLARLSRHADIVALALATSSVVTTLSIIETLAVVTSARMLRTVE